MKKNKKSLLIIFVVGAIAIISTTLSKYIYNSAWNYYLKSREFYFESDSLEVNTKNNSLLTWDGSDIYFVIKNSNNDNLVTEYDINYTVTCNVLGEESYYIDCNLNNTKNNSYQGVLVSSSGCIDVNGSADVSNLTKSACELNGYKWVNEVSKKDVPFNLILKDSTKTIDELDVEIIAESTSPYKKILKGIFHLNKKEEETTYLIEYQSFDIYDEISIINKTSSDKCFYVEFNSDIYTVNSGNEYILGVYEDENSKINKIKVKIIKQNSGFIEFYKLDAKQNYSIDEFKIIETDC